MNETERLRKEQHEDHLRIAAKQEADNERIKAERAEMLRLAEERKQDGEKLVKFADEIDDVVGPPVETQWAKDLLSVADARLSGLADDLRGAVVAEA